MREKPNLFEFFRTWVPKAKAKGTIKWEKNQIYLSFSEREYLRRKPKVRKFWISERKESLLSFPNVKNLSKKRLIFQLSQVSFHHKENREHGDARRIIFGSSVFLCALVKTLCWKEFSNFRNFKFDFPYNRAIRLLGDSPPKNPSNPCNPLLKKNLRNFE